MPENETRKISVEEWMGEGKALFGDDPRLWRFKCANCHHVQTIADFIELRDLGLYRGDVQNAYYSCIGRYDTRIPESKIGTITDRKSPCDYTLGGLFRFVKTIVVDHDGTEKHVFEFAKDRKEVADGTNT